MSHRRLLLTALLGALFCISAESFAKSPLFELGQPVNDERLHSQWAHAVAIDAYLDLRGAGELTLPLPDGRSLALKRQDVLKTQLGNYLWRGSVNGTYDALHFALLAFNEGHISGFIHLPETRMYEIRPVPGGHLFMFADQGSFPPCAGGMGALGSPDPHPQRKYLPSGRPDPQVSLQALPPELRKQLPDTSAAMLTGEDLRLGVVTQRSSFPRANEILDIMLVYTNQAAARISDISVHADSAIALGNQAYQNSQITPRLSLVSASTVNYDDTNNSSTDLPRLRGTTDGFMDAIHLLRDSVGADMVASIHNDLGSSCGRGYVMTFPNSAESTPFNVTDMDCISNHTLTHEIGHNQGMAHDRANAGVDGYYSYSYGQQRQAQGYRTVLAYSCSGGSCGRRPYLSNPLVSYNGIATGIDQSQSDSADNALTLTQTSQSIQDFRDTVVGTPIPTPTLTQTPTITPSPTPLPVITGPFVETFESSALCGTTCGDFCDLGSVYLYNDSNRRWTVDTGTTPSTITGPSGDFTSGSGRFVYTEASSTCIGAVYTMRTASIDLSGFAAPRLRFASHMYGEHMGTLEVIVAQGGSETTVFSDNRDTNAWQTHTINLDGYKGGGDIVIRFVGSTGSSYRSDMALDDIELFDVPPTLTPTASPAPTSSPSPSPTATSVPTLTPTPTATPTAPPTATLTATPSPTFSPTPSPTSSETPTPTTAPTQTPTETPTLLPTQTPTSTPEPPTPTETPTNAPSTTPSPSPTEPPTETPTPTPSVTPTESPSPTATPAPPTPTETPTSVPTETPSPTNTAAPMATASPSPTESPTQTPTVAPEPTETPTVALVATPTPGPPEPVPVDSGPALLLMVLGITGLMAVRWGADGASEAG